MSSRTVEFIDRLVDALSYDRRRGKADAEPPPIGFADQFVRALAGGRGDEHDAYTAHRADSDTASAMDDGEPERRIQRPLTIGDVVDIVANAVPSARLANRLEVDLFAKAVRVVILIKFASVNPQARANALVLAGAIGEDLIQLNSINANAIIRANASIRANAIIQGNAIIRANAIHNSLVAVRALEHALDRDPRVGRADRIARDLASALAKDLVRAMDAGRREIRVDDIDASTVDRLRRVANDFTRADLSGIDLAGVQLDGVQWSEATAWPPDWIERIRRDSVDIGHGVYEIRRGAANADDHVLTAL